MAIVDEEMKDVIESRQVYVYLEALLFYFVRDYPLELRLWPFHDPEAVFQKEMTDHQSAVLLLRTLSYQAHVFVSLLDIFNL